MLAIRTARTCRESVTSCNPVGCIRTSIVHHTNCRHSRTSSMPFRTHRRTDRPLAPILRPVGRARGVRTVPDTAFLDWTSHDQFACRRMACCPLRRSNLPPGTGRRRSVVSSGQSRSVSLQLIVIRSPGRQSLIAAAILAGMAPAVKQTFIAAPGAVFIWLPCRGASRTR